MASMITAPGAVTSGASCDKTDAVSRSLLGYGVIAGPIYLTVGLIQALTRDGFDLSRHDLSLLANGDFGWVQITNLVLTGVMTIAAAVGMRRVLRRGPAGTWAPRLIGVYGAGLIAAGAFVADPMNGFPLGTPAGPPAAVSWHGMLHLVSGAVGFLCLIAACFVVAQRFAGRGQHGWAWYSRTTGAVFLAGFVGIASGSGSSAVVLGFWIAVVAAWAWVSALSVHLYRQTPAQGEQR